MNRRKLFLWLLALALTAQFAGAQSTIFLSAATATPPAEPEAGDTISFAIRDDGWSADWVVKGMDTNGTWDFNYDTNNTPNASVPKLTVYSPGFTDAGVSNWTARTVYLTKQVRFPYPNQAFTDQGTDGSYLTNRISLSDYVYVGDVATLDLPANLYNTNSVSSAAESAFSVVNSSAMVWPQVIGNWTWPGFNLITNTMTLRAAAFHASAQSGRPVRAITFWAVDQSGNGVTNTVTTPIVRRTDSDALSVAEYIADLDVSGMDQGELITCNFIAYPWHGTTPLDTANSGFVFPTGLPAAQTNVVNNAGTYGVTRAVVDTASGSDTDGRAANEVYWATNTSPPAFATIGRAILAVSQTNNGTYSRNNPGGGIVYLTAGNHLWLGSSLSLSVEQATWLTVQNLTNGAVITEYNSDQRGLDDKDKFKLVGLNYLTTTQPHSRQHIWHDRCFMDISGSGFYATSTAKCIWYLTGNTITNLSQGLRSQSGQQLVPAIVRGNNLTGFRNIAQPYMMLGNTNAPTEIGSNLQIQFDLASQQWEIPAYGVFYNNALFGLDTLGNILQAPANFNATNGFVIVQNVLEQTTNNTASTAFAIGTINTLNFTNGIVWNNTLVGTKTFYGYNDSGEAAAYRYLWSTFNNVWDDYNLKSDNFTTQNANRVGNWPLMFGVNYAGNLDLATTGIGAPDSFINDDAVNLGFMGVNSASLYTLTSATSSTNFAAFVDRQAHDGVNSMPGGGNYRLTAESPLLLWPTSKWVLSHDLAGQERSLTDPPGAFTYVAE